MANTCRRARPMTTTIKPPPAVVRALLQRRVRLQELKQRCMDDAVMYYSQVKDIDRELDRLAEERRVSELADEINGEVVT